MFHRRRRLVGGKHHVLFGAPEPLHPRLAQRGWQINPSCAERLNLDLRQHVAALGRQGNTLGKHEDGGDRH